jgi:Alcohol dehydrogenase GroES-like domain
VRSFGGGPFDELIIEGYPVRCGFVSVPEPVFEPDGQHRSDVLVDVRAFSCNYRDKALILRMSVIPADRGFYVIGSELGGRVIAVGAAVGELAPGDRVMIDGFFGGGVRPWGLPTNHASRSRQVLPARKLMRVPDAMSDEEAAAFPIGGQTSCAMVRRAGLRPGHRPLQPRGRPPPLAARESRRQRRRPVQHLAHCVPDEQDQFREDVQARMRAERSDRDRGVRPGRSEDDQGRVGVCVARCQGGSDILRPGITGMAWLAAVIMAGRGRRRRLPSGLWRGA